MTNARAQRYQITIPSPVGDLLLVATNEALIAVSWIRAGEEFDQRPNALLEEAARQFERYFAGGEEFDLPLDPGGSDFQRRGWKAMTEIPRGQTESYGSLARRIDSMPRAVGGLCATNPIPIIQPCHRVVASGGKLGGFSGGTGLDTKQWLLRHEGVLEPLLI